MPINVMWRGPTTTGQTKRSEKLHRSVRVRGLPEWTQEGLLQQVIEKHAAVRRVVFDADTLEATVELVSPAVRYYIFSCT